MAFGRKASLTGLSQIRGTLRYRPRFEARRAGAVAFVADSQHPEAKNLAQDSPL